MMLNTVVLLTLLMGCCLADDAGLNLNLGEAINVPRTDLLGSIPSGIPVYQHFDDSCFQNVDIGITNKYDNYYKETAVFYKSLSVGSGISASLQSDFTMGLTLDATTKSISSTKRTVSGNSLKMAAKSHKRVLKAGCMLNGSLDSRLVKAFVALNDTVANPWLPESWRNFEIFLNTFGSHVITEVIYGSSIDQYAFAQTSSQYSQRDFTVKSCVSLAGPGGTMESMNLSLCSNVSQEEMSSVQDMEMTDSLTLRGGTNETRNRLLYDRSEAVRTKFMDEGYTNPGAIQFTLKPIWEILQSIFVDGPHLRKAINLEYYYEGYNNFGCAYQQIKTESVTVELQKFELASHSTPQYPEYQCSLAPLGCHTYKDDCHYHVGVWCYCSGPTCIRYSQKTLNTGAKKEMASPYYGKDWGWNGCGWKLWGSQCRCTEERHERTVVWSGSSKSAIYASSDQIRKIRAQLHPKERIVEDVEIKIRTEL